jgi:hypothetical protein
MTLAFSPGGASSQPTTELPGDWLAGPCEEPLIPAPHLKSRPPCRKPVRGSARCADLSARASTPPDIRRWLRSSAQCWRELRPGWSERPASQAAASRKPGTAESRLRCRRPGALRWRAAESVREGPGRRLCTGTRAVPLQGRNDAPFKLMILATLRNDEAAMPRWRHSPTWRVAVTGPVLQSSESRSADHVMQYLVNAAGPLDIDLADRFEAPRPKCTRESLAQA